MERAREAPTDVQLVYMVKLQRIVDSIGQTLPRGENPLVKGPQIPTYMAIKTLQHELYEFRKTWPEELQQNTVLLLGYYSAEVFLNETVLLEKPDSPSGPMDRLECLEILNNCLISAKSFLDLYRTIPQSHWPYFPFTIWIQAGLVVQTANELAFFDHPGWDRPYIRSQLDVPSIVEFQLSGVQNIINIRRTQEMGVSNKDIFHRLLRRWSNHKSAYESRLSAETERKSTMSQMDVNKNANVPAVLPNMEDIYMGGLYYDFDSAFWQDFGMGVGAWGADMAAGPTFSAAAAPTMQYGGAQ